jgi:hypothetical protein
MYTDLLHVWKRIYRTAERVSFVSDSEVFVMFVTPDGEGTERNIWLLKSNNVSM